MFHAAANPNILAYVDPTFFPAGTPFTARAPGGRRNCLAFFDYARKPRTPIEATLITFRILGFLLGAALFLMGILYISLPATFGANRVEPIAALIVGPVTMTFFFFEAYLCTGHLVDPAGLPVFITELVFQVFNLILNACALGWLALFDFGRQQDRADWWVFVMLFSLNGFLALAVAITMTVMIFIAVAKREKAAVTVGSPGPENLTATA
ncbi:hypothetical protein BZA05DRAFT_419003 [Tricharina praecox]|uniref:uncharacterized protein n=1 Tax=Tricharina praecox TaxID=43433 RepID=UPI002221222B|nr:uncharacterized protein BZA05DRAFT_419003 [Tricharina praecox]KAI5850932.1 hypothetical protein BZA05DRAFT_419003 [Tricharina praecox]